MEREIASGNLLCDTGSSGFPCGSAGKESTCSVRPGFDPWVGKIPWRKERLPTPVFRPGEFHGLYSPWVQSRVLGCNLKNDRMISVLFQGKPFNIRVNQVYAPTNNAEEAEVKQFCEDLQDFLELTPQKRCPFHYRGLEHKTRKSRDTWSNRQIWPWSTK